MVWWILVPVLVVAAAYSFWPRRGGIDDRRARGDVNTFQGRVELWNNDRGRVGGGF
ncbi:hypothetical protein [Nocardioides ungokensis]|uniref:hypothetical protein n=1 Tax=Nocardioides ungokensis TaxID=1643322 RepID=UPI0015DF1D73|nr:hypothetical protein [Nocardioides ungokensis]